MLREMKIASVRQFGILYAISSVSISLKWIIILFQWHGKQVAFLHEKKKWYREYKVVRSLYKTNLISL